jgi:hypothetical protein
MIGGAFRTRHQGIEAGFGASLLKGLWITGPNPDRLWLNVAYTYSDFRYDNDAAFGDNRLPGAPPHYARAELLYKHPSGVAFGPNVAWVPESYFVDDSVDFRRGDSVALLIDVNPEHCGRRLAAEMHNADQRKEGEESHRCNRRSLRRRLFQLATLQISHSRASLGSRTRARVIRSART